MKIPQNILKKDPILAAVVRSSSLPIIVKRKTTFEALVSSIVSQQLSIKAAATIFGRFKILVGRSFSPRRILQLTPESMREAGLSRQKAVYIQNIATYFSEAHNKKFNWSEAEDEEIINRLTEIKGVGVWTVQMLLIFQLDKQNVFPAGDLAIQQKMTSLYKIKGKKKEILQKMEIVASKWSPYRSVASRYLWEYELKKEA